MGAFAFAELAAELDFSLRVKGLQQVLFLGEEFIAYRRSCARSLSFNTGIPWVFPPHSKPLPLRLTPPLIFNTPNIS